MVCLYLPLYTKVFNFLKKTFIDAAATEHSPTGPTVKIKPEKEAAEDQAQASEDTKQVTEAEAAPPTPPNAAAQGVKIKSGTAAEDKAQDLKGTEEEVKKTEAKDAKQADVDNHLAGQDGQVPDTCRKEVEKLMKDPKAKAKYGHNFTESFAKRMVYAEFHNKRGAICDGYKST